MNESVLVKPRNVVEYGKVLTHSESVAEPGESSFKSFDLSILILCMIVKANKKRKIGISKNSEKKNRRISWEKKQNLSRPTHNTDTWTM